jgi:hypothetical protein
VGGGIDDPHIQMAVIGKNSQIPEDAAIDPGAEIDADVIDSDYPSKHIPAGTRVVAGRRPYEI